jgi:hypothetical protein
VEEEVAGAAPARRRVVQGAQHDTKGLSAARVEHHRAGREGQRDHAHGSQRPRALLPRQDDGGAAGVAAGDDRSHRPLGAVGRDVGGCGRVAEARLFAVDAPGCRGRRGRGACGARRQAEGHQDAPPHCAGAQLRPPPARPSLLLWRERALPVRRRRWTTWRTRAMRLRPCPRRRRRARASRRASRRTRCSLSARCPRPTCPAARAAALLPQPPRPPVRPGRRARLARQSRARDHPAGAAATA